MIPFIRPPPPLLIAGADAEHVYDMATLLVSELRYLESKLPPSTDTRAWADFRPGRKLPAHNVQRAGLLEAQIEQISKQVAAHTESLKGTSGK
jgi:hypothetical protein